MACCHLFIVDGNKYYRTDQAAKADQRRYGFTAGCRSENLGMGSPGEEINAEFAGFSYQAKADGAGNWNFHLQKTGAGGPFTMTLTASNTVTVSDILMGDVWLCSGQSNMELPMRRVAWIYPDVIRDSANDQIRHFYVPRHFDLEKSLDDLATGSWKKANPVDILEFSATAYFFAREIYATQKVPVGLINSAYGGSPVEAWISEDALKSFPVYHDEVLKFKDGTLMQSIQQEDNARINRWHRELNAKDEGYTDPAGTWHQSETNRAAWNHFRIPGYWADQEPGFMNGVIWFRRTVQLSREDAGKPAEIILGVIVDSDSVFVNGRFAGTTGYQYPPRRYKIPDGALKEGENIIVVRVVNESGRGGFVPEKPYELVTGDKTVPLEGDWQYRIGGKMDRLMGRTFFNTKPAGLFNAMLHPVVGYTLKGVIWYQGESNADRAADYNALFSTLITDWRTRWGEPALPFLFVQLPNFMQPRENPSESNWALLREAQLKATALPATGMAVAIDIGEWNDIHPLNKQDVGYRLSLAARKVAYRENSVVFSGPVYRSMEKSGKRIILSFDLAGSGLAIRGEAPLKEFAIAGADRKFVWAEAEIVDGKVIVWNDQVAEPVAVRYAWSDNPAAANLVNREGLPASPFRTDDWPRPEISKR
jgi:sialate O-acetylesterase